VDVRVPLPKDEAATLLAALESAKDQFGQSPEKPVGEAPTGPTYTRTDALLDVARGFLQTAPEDRSGEDRTLLVVHVFAGNLAADQLQNVPAGTSSGAVDPICHIAGVGSIEPETARRLARDADLLGPSSTGTAEYARWGARDAWCLGCSDESGRPPLAT
jgi:hypothetical protein